ncbi:N-6 DNA methylase [Leptolyngbya sp. DQ-M1]|uniref:HsdM family class I SAM-dependent methyltransferase n=1 Tax=Leptolyngbya sp. DQ-M1 TaxID=2933920 RepID=UPI00329A138D
MLVKILLPRSHAETRFSFIAASDFYQAKEAHPLLFAFVLKIMARARVSIKCQDHFRVATVTGTCGFLVNAYEYILEKYTSPEILYDEKGYQHLVGDRLSDEERQFLQTKAFTAYDNDSGMTMLRIGSMNLMLHGIQRPRLFYKDTLSKGFDDERSLDVVLMNPPFKGKMDESDIHEKLPSKVKKTELLFLHLILRVLEMGGRCAVIVPDGVLFGSSRAHVELRKKIIEENRFDLDVRFVHPP